MGCKPILEQFYWFQRGQNRKRHRRVVAALTLTLGVNGPLTDSSWASNNVPVKWWRVSYTQSPPCVVHSSNFQFLLARGLPPLKMQVFHKKFTFPFGVEGAFPPLKLSPLSEVQFSNFQLLGREGGGDFLHCPLWDKSWGFDKKYLLPVQILCFTESLHVETNEDHC